MEKITIQTGNHYSSVLLGESISNLPAYLPHDRVIIVTDEKVNSLYGKYIDHYPVVIIGTGENAKNLETVGRVLSKFLEYEADRSTFILGFGGGIVCDVSGFAASVYMRGLHFGFVSSTLLSQVDASVGGKNGVNLMGYKNMVGVFRQPEFVLCDYALLRTLDRQEFVAGFAEIIKSAMIRDSALFDYFSRSVKDALQQDPEVIHHLVKGSVQIKASVVQTDERERGERRLLNFGHTFGHAIEKLTGMIHGEAIGIGMVMAARLSVKLGYLSSLQMNALVKVLRDTGLPTEAPVSEKEILMAMHKDKKKENDRIHFVLCDRIGSAFTKQLTFQEIENDIHDLC